MLNNLWLYSALYLLVDSFILISALLDRKLLVSKINAEKVVGLGVRVLAQLADIFFAILLSWLIFGVLFLVNKRILLNHSINQWMSSYFWEVFILIALVIHFFHSTLCTAAFGKTIGKMMLKIRVEVIDGSKLSYAIAVKRYASYSLYILSAGYGFFDLARNKQKQGIHDRIVNTRVVYTGVPNLITVITILLILHLVGTLRLACC